MIIGKRGSLVILRGTDAIITFAGGNKIFALVSNSSSASKPCTGKPRNKHSMIPILHWLNLNQNLIVSLKKYQILARLKKPQISRSNYSSKARVEEEDDQQT